MDTLDKKSLLEKDIEDLFILPALQESGWRDAQIVRQESYTAGRIIVRRGSANLWTRGERKRPDIILYLVPHLPLPKDSRPKRFGTSKTLCPTARKGTPK